MFEPIKAPLSRAEALAKLNHYVSVAPVKVKRTFFGTKVYLYEDGTKIALFGDMQYMGPGNEEVGLYFTRRSKAIC